MCIYAMINWYMVALLALQALPPPSQDECMVADPSHVAMYLPHFPDPFCP